MTRIYQSGIEMNTLTGGLTEADAASVLTNAAIDASVKRSGNYSLRFDDSGNWNTPVFASGAGVTSATARGYYRLAGSPTTGGRILIFKDMGGADYCSLRIKTDRKVELVKDQTTPIILATSASALPAGDFTQCLELFLDVPRKVVGGRVNGQTMGIANVSGFADATGNIGHVRWGPNAVTLGTDLWIDDLAVNSLDGSINNSWCGPSAGVLTDWPVGDLPSTSWTAQGGGLLYAQIDEEVPDDATTYIKETAGVNGAGAGFYFGAFPQRGPAYAMTFGVRGGGTDITSRLANFQFHDANDASTGGVSANVDWNLNGWKTVYPILTIEQALDGTRRMINNGYLSPSAWPGLWAVPGLSRGIMVRADALARQINVSTVWRTVDYAIAVTPNVVPPGSPSQQILVTSDP